MKKMKTFISVCVNIFIRIPMIILANVFWGLSELLKAIGDGFDHCQQIMKKVCMLPFLSDIEKEIKDIDEKDRKRLLKKLQQNLDI